MLCCCRRQLDITDDQPPAAKPAPIVIDKEKAFSEAVTAHPSPVHSPIVQQLSGTAEAQVGKGEPAPQTQVAVVKPFEKQNAQDTSKKSTEKSAVADKLPLISSEIISGTSPSSKAVVQASESDDKSYISGGDSKHVSVVNVTSTGVKKDSGARKLEIVASPADTGILSQIEALAQGVERAATEGTVKDQTSCSNYAIQLCHLTSQVRQSANKMSESVLLNAVSRLEAVASRLESLSLRGSGAFAGGDTGVVAPFVTAFDDFLAGSFAQFVSLGSQIGGDVKNQLAIVDAAFKAERLVLEVASKSKQPSQADLFKVVQPVAEKIQAVQDFRENNRRSAQFNHLSALSESVSALGWIAVTPAPGPFVKEMKDAAMFYTNRVLKDFKDSDTKQADWAKAWIATLTELQDYIKQYHTTGLTWNPQGGDATSARSAPSAPAAGGAPPPPPPGPPPPPPPPADHVASSGGGSDSRTALFAALSKGEAVTSGLKKVSDDMKTYKNPALRQGPAPFKVTTPKPVAAPKPGAKSKEGNKPPLTELQNKKWVIEYHDGNKNIILDRVELKHAVYIYKCTNSVVHVKSKVNSIILDQCKKTGIVFEGVVSSLEFVNCQSMQGQVTGKVPTISIDKTDGCMIYLSKDSLDTVIVTAKSSEMNVLVPVGDGDFREFALPEQFRTTWNGTSMVTVQADSI